MTKIIGKQKRMVLFIRIEVYYLILPNKYQSEIIISIYNRQNIQNNFSNFPILN